MYAAKSTCTCMNCGSAAQDVSESKGENLKINIWRSERLLYDSVKAARTPGPAPMKRTPQEIYKATDPAARAQWYLKTVGPPVSADAAEPLCRKRDLYFLSVKITTYWYSYFLTRIKTQRL